MEVARREYRRGFTVPNITEVKRVLALAVVGRANWASVALRSGRVILDTLTFDVAKHELLQAHINDVVATMGEALRRGDYWFKSYETPHNWMPVVRRIDGMYYVATSGHIGAMDRLAERYGQQQALTMLQLKVQFPPPPGLRARELVELNLSPIADALRGTCLAQFTAAQLATTICQGSTYPGSSRPSAGGRLVLFLDANACVMLDVSSDTVADFNQGWRQKEGEPGTIIVPLKRDSDTYEKEVAGAVHSPTLRFTFTGAVDSELLGPTAFYGINGNPGVPVVSAEHENYLVALADALEVRLQAIPESIP